MNTDIVNSSGSVAATQTIPAPQGGAARVASVREVTPQPPTRAELSTAVKEISAAVQSVQRNLSFTIDDDTGSTVVKVVDSQSDEVIRQFPSEEILALRRRLNEMSDNELSGLLVQTKA